MASIRVALASVILLASGLPALAQQDNAPVPPVYVVTLLPRCLWEWNKGGVRRGSRGAVVYLQTTDGEKDGGLN